MTSGRTGRSQANVHSPASGHRADPLPILLLRRGSVGARQLVTLEQDPRIALFAVRDLTPDAVSVAQRVAAVLVATARDPLDALTYVVTAGVSTPIVVALGARYKRQVRDVLSAGATACLVMPVTPTQVDEVLEQLTHRGGPSRVDSTLRLLLDPIARIARYHEQSVQLSPREFALLHRLSNSSGRPVSADELLSYVWAEKAPDQTRQILDVYIFNLRKKLEQLGLGGAICTVRRFGYALVQVSDADEGAAPPKATNPSRRTR